VGRPLAGESLTLIFSGWPNGVAHVLAQCLYSERRARLHQGIVPTGSAAGDPLVGMAADIDYNGILSIDLDPGTNKITRSFRSKIFPSL
jgi:hypothetical protein